jgi:uncharacterized protein
MMASMRDIRALGRQIGERFHPERVVLFGSHAHGSANEDSDVDLLVVMPFRGKPATKSAEIRLAINPPFPTDLILRTPATVRRRLAMGDGFLADILERGKVLYEAHHVAV